MRKLYPGVFYSFYISFYTFFFLCCSVVNAQPWTYDFGTGTGTANNSNAGSGNTAFFTGTPSGGGTYRVRIGSAGGSLVLANPGTTLGSGSEAQLNAPTSTSSNKFGVYDWNSPSVTAYIKFKIRTTSSGTGNLNISAGINTIANDNQGFTSHYNNSLASMRINYASGAISSVQRRTSGADNAVSSSGITKDADQVVELFLNNGSSSTTYAVSGTTYTLNAQQWDLWVDGTKVSPANGWAKAGSLAAGTNISGFCFFAESSASNAGFIYLDDLEYANVLPVPPTVTTPVATSVTHNSAILGATVTSAGTASLSARGTSYKTSSPVAATDNQLAEGGTSVSAFSHSRSGLSPQTAYFYAGYATNSFGTALSSEGNFYTLSNPPSVQASALSVSTPTATTLNLSIGTPATFPASGASQAGYAIIYSTGTPTLGSANGQAPSAGTGTLFSVPDAVLPATPSTSIQLTGLTSATLYNILVVPYTWDGTNASTYHYLTTSAPTTDGTTDIASEPTGQASFTGFADVQTSALTIQFAAGTGGTGRLVVVRQDNPVDFVPADASSYTANTDFTAGTGLGTSSDNKVVYNGSGTSVTVTNLSALTTYYIAVYEFNGSGAAINYLTTNPATASTSTLNNLATEPTTDAGTLSISNLTTSSYDLNWGAALSVDGYVVVRRSGGTPEEPQDGTVYAANDALGINSVVVYSGSNLMVAQSSLSSGTAYQYHIYTYNGSGSMRNYRTSAFASGTFYTLSDEPSAHAASFTNTVNSATGITLSFSAAGTLPADGYLLLRKTSTFSGSDYPEDGNAYADNDAIGGASAVTTITSDVATSYNNTVTADGAFFYLLVPFNWDGTNPETRNYYTAGTIPVSNAVTPSGASDAIPVTSSEAATIASTLNTSAITADTDGEQVWQFTLRDGGVSGDADTLPTSVTALTVTQSAGNQVNDFSNAIQSVALFNGAVLVPATVVVTATEIRFTALTLSVPDNGSITLSMRLSVKANVNGGASTGSNADGDDFGFELTSANITTGAPSASSQAASFSAIASADSRNIYTVNATKLQFVQQPSLQYTLVNITPAVTVEATDAGGNRDLGFAADIDLSATGATLVSAPVTATAGSGLATFSNLQFSTAGTAVTLTAQSTGLTNAESNEFEIEAGVESYTYRTLRSGNWKEVSAGNEVWERSLDGNTWVTVTAMEVLPTHTAGAITIRNGHTVNIAASVSVDELTIEPGAQLTVNASQTLTVANGTGTDLTVNGTLFNNAGTVTLSGTASFESGGTLRIGSGSAGDFLSTNATYDAASTIEITGVVAQTSYSFPTKTIGNLVWNNASQTSNLNTSGTIANLTINGSFTLQSTGSGSLRLTGSSNLNLVIGGNLNIQTGASLDIDNNATGTSAISIGGNFNMTGGTFQSSADNVLLTFTGTGKTFTRSGGTFTSTNFNWTVASGASVTLNNDLSVASGRLVTVDGTLHFGSHVISGLGSFTLSASGTIGIGSADGISAAAISGNIQAGDIVTLNAAATYLYNGTSAQVTGDGLPASVTGNITISNTNGVTLSNITELAGVLTLQSGQLDAAGKLTLTSAASLLYAGGTLINFTLPAALDNYSIESGIATLSGNLTVTGTLDLGDYILNIGNNTLTLSGDLSRQTGSIRTNGGSLVVNGSSLDDSLFFDQTTPDTTNKLSALTLNRAGSTILLGNALSVSGTVTLTAGTLASDSNLTLLSSLTGTARIAEIAIGADITGAVTIQRYMIGGTVSQRGWRTMCSPVQSFSYSQFSDDLLLTGPGGTSNGFDAPGSNASVRYYEESASRGWSSITSTSDVLGTGKGMLVFFRGDRTQTTSLTNNNVVPNDVVLDFTGPVNKNSIPVALDYFDSGEPADDGFNLVGNPYPCEVIWDDITKSAGVDVSFWILNPNTGNYVSQTGSTQIASGQGFFVQVISAAESITFEESMKSNGNPTSYFKTNATPFTVKMMLDSVRYDIAWLSFDASASRNYVFKEDTRKLKNTVYNVSFFTPDSQLVQRNVSSLLSNVSDTFILQVTSTTPTTYTLAFEELTYISSGKDIYLVDNYLNTVTDVRDTQSYQFTIDPNIPGTFGNRFQLVFHTGSNLPVNILSFKARKEASQNIITLEVAQEKNIRHYALLKSVDGNHFETIRLIAAFNHSSARVYQVTDPASDVTVFYKIVVHELNGTAYESETLVLNGTTDNREKEIGFYPNPAAGRIVIDTEEPVTLRVSDLTGKILLREDHSVEIDVSELKPGIYMLEISTDNRTKTMKFIKN